MATRPEFIGGPTGGVPESIFSQLNRTDTTEGESGAPLQYTITPDLLVIKVPGEEDMPSRFHASVNADTLHLSISNKGRFNRDPRHPDIYAGRLVRRFMDHAAAHGRTIKRIRGKWGLTSDNYKEFVHNMQTADENDAALDTWTGRVARSLGYPDAHVDPKWRKEAFVIVDFEKTAA